MIQLTHLKCIHWNAGGQVHNTNELFDTDADVLAFTETWDFKTGHKKFDGRKDYFLFTCCRSAPALTTRGRQHGGIAMYIKKSVCLGSAPQLIQSHADKGIICVRIQALQLAIIVAYFSPAGARGYSRGYLAGDPFLHLAETITQMQNLGLSIVLLGDMNARTGLLSDVPDFTILDSNPQQAWYEYIPSSRKSKDSVDNPFGRSLIQLLQNSSLVLLNGRAPHDEQGHITCLSKRGNSTTGSVVDVACVSAHLYNHVSSFSILSPFHGDHMPCILDISLPPPFYNKNASKQRQYRPTGSLLESYSNHIINCSKQLSELTVALQHNTLSAEQGVNEIIHIISTSMACARIGSGTEKAFATQGAPWWCDELSVARDHERAMRKQHESHTADLDAWQNAKSCYRRLLRHHKRAFYQQQSMSMINSYFSSNPQSFWSSIKPAHAPCEFTELIEATEHFERIYGSDEDTSHPEDKFTTELRKQLLIQHMHDKDSMTCLNDPIALHEVQKAIASLPNGKASGADGITAECFKVVDGCTEESNQYVLAPVLTALLNVVFIHGDYPNHFCLNTLTPVYKGKGDIKDLNSYRGIAVGSLFCKLFESVLYHRYNNQLESQGLRNPAQFGFRKNHGTLDGLFVLRHLVDKAINSNNPLYALFIDFEKAFDRVSRKELVDRCVQLGCSGKFLRAIVNMLDNIQMQVKLNGQFGVPFQTSNRGIKQGGLLSPLKFGSFMEQLHDLIALKLPGMGPKIGTLMVPLLMYADDVTALCTSPEHMNHLIEHIQLFCKMFGMKINASKTFAVVFHQKGAKGLNFKRLIKKCVWKIDGQPVEIKHEAKFLGLLFHDTKGCMAAPSTLAAKGSKALYSMLALMKSHHINQSAFLCRMFDQLVNPILSYGCQVWGPDVCINALAMKDVLNRIRVVQEGVHIDFLRRIGGLPSSSPLWILFKEFDRIPLHFQWLTLCARFWGKATADPAALTTNNVLLRASMRDNIRLAMSNSNCWVSKFLNCLVHANVISQESLDACSTVQHFLDLPISESFVKIKLKGLWNSLCEQVFGDVADPRGFPDDAPVTSIRYRAWVDCQAKPPHLTAFLPTFIKHEILRLRCTSYPLAIQMGRRQRVKVPRSMRLCKACLIDNVCACVEDDKHFLMECPAYDFIRLKYDKLFHEGSTPVSVLNFPDQNLFGRVLHEMLQHRSTLV